MWTPPKPWRQPAYGSDAHIFNESSGEFPSVLVFAFTSINSDGKIGFIKYMDVENNEKAIFVDSPEMSISRCDRTTGEKCHDNPLLSLP
jgi:hypothetical protein